MCFSWWNWGWSSIFSWLFYRTWFFYNHDQPCIKYQFPRARGEVLNNRGNRRNRPNAWLARMPSDEFSNVWWYINLDIHESVQKKKTLRNYWNEPFRALPGRYRHHHVNRGAEGWLALINIISIKWAVFKTPVGLWLWWIILPHTLGITIIL